MRRANSSSWRDADRAGAGDRAGKRSRILALAGVLLGMSGALAAAAAGGETPAPARAARTFDELLGGLRLTTTPSGRVVVVGHTPVDNLQVSQWAEDVVERVASVTGLPCPFDRRHPLTVELDTSPVTPAAPELPSAAISERGHRLVVRDFARLPSDTAHASLCRCVLSAAMFPPPVAAGEASAVPGVPGWLVCGVSRCLYPPRRAGDAEAVQAAWEDGKLDTLTAFLDRMAAAGDEEPTNLIDRARSGFVVSWLAATPGRSGAFSRLLRIAADGEVAGSAELAQMLGGGFTPTGLEEAWDRRVLRERRVVSQPGRSSPDAVRRFRAALLIYPGLSGMPLSDEPYRTIDWSSLIALRDQSWMPAFCVQKSNGLRMAAVGRGEAVMRAAEAYCALLAGLREGRSERRLNRLLADAVEAEAGLNRAQTVAGQTEGAAGAGRTPAGEGMP